MRGSDQIYMFMYSILKMPLNSQNWGFEHLFSALTKGRRRGKNRAMNDPLVDIFWWTLHLGGGEHKPGAEVGKGEHLNSTPGGEKSWGVGGAGGGAVMEPQLTPALFFREPARRGFLTTPPPHNCIQPATCKTA